MLTLQEVRQKRKEILSRAKSLLPEAEYLQFEKVSKKLKKIHILEAPGKRNLKKSKKLRKKC